MKDVDVCPQRVPERRNQDRRHGRRRKCDKTVLNTHRRLDHWWFAMILVALFFGIEHLSHFHWSGKGIEFVVAASVHQLLFGRG